MQLSEIGVKLAPDIFLIRPQLVKYLTSNSLLFTDEKNLLIDSGFQYNSKKFIQLKNILYPDLIFFSHYHADHIYGCHYFPNSKKMIHKSERNALVSIDNFMNFSFNYQKLTVEDYTKWYQRFFNLLKLENLDNWDDLFLDNVQVIPDNYLLDIGENQLEIIHLPGHTPGMCGIYEPVHRILFISDFDISGKFGPWYGWKNANLSLFKSSVEKLKQFIYNNDISIVIPSHSNPLDKQNCLIGLEIFNNIFENRKKLILDFILEKKRTTIEEISKQSFIYKMKQSNPPFVWLLFEQIHVEKHLEELISLRLISMEDNEVIAII